MNPIEQAPNTLDEFLAQKPARRRSLCEAIVGRVEVIRDGLDHSNKSSRCLVDDNGRIKCVGYYEVLTKYDPATDCFNNHIPAAHVERVAFHEALDMLIEMAYGLFTKDAADENQRPD